MEKISVKELSPERGPIFGIALVAHSDIELCRPGVVSDSKGSINVPFLFYRGDLEMVRTELHNLIDHAIDSLNK